MSFLLGFRLFCAGALVGAGLVLEYQRYQREATGRARAVALLPAVPA